MRLILAYIISSIHYAIMTLWMYVFHVLQVIAYNLFGYSAHKKTVEVLNFLLLANMLTNFCRPSFHGFKKIPKNTPLIIVANHQSMYDIPPVVWGFRKHHPKFISKKELGKKLPSISYNLQKGGSALIDRKNGSQAIKEIIKLGRNMEEKNWSACIFPEGSRSLTGELRKFQLAGFKTLLKASPSALIVPLSIDGNYKLHRWGKFPLDFGKRIKYIAHTPIARDNYSDEELLEKVRTTIQESLTN